MRIQLDFVENGVIMTVETPEEGKNAEKKEILVFQHLTEVFDALSYAVAENNAEKG